METITLEKKKSNFDKKFHDSENKTALNFEERFKNGLTADELKKRTIAFIKSLPWKNF